MKVDASTFNRRINKLLNNFPENMMEELAPVVKSNTPIRSGNARNKTKLNQSSKLQIKSNYPYAGRLNKGWSKQAPKGFIDPSLKKLPSIIKKLLRKI